MDFQRGTTVQLGSVEYLRYLPAELSKELKECDKITPVVVLNSVGSDILLENLENTLAKLIEEDDVFTSDFMANNLLVFQSLQLGSSKANLPVEVVEYLEKTATRCFFLQWTSDEDILPQGPYFASHKGLHQAWRLYEDKLAAFVSTTFPADHSNYEFNPVGVVAGTGLHRAVAVPSRLYYPRSAAKPLNGIRVAVKDNIHLNGVVTTLGSRSYTECYGVQKQTATFVKHLIDQGAVIVGKTKMSSYAGSEIPPEKCIDYFPPWNARADGYQGPSGSSSGSGASAGGYSWLDLAFGTDTTGSARMPAAAHGLWGLKASWNLFPMQGVVPSVPPFDSFGIFARSYSEIQRVLLSSGIPELDERKLPIRILYPTDWFPYKNPAQQQMTEEFVGILEELLGVTRTNISLKDEWTRSAPENFRQIPITEFLYDIIKISQAISLMEMGEEITEEERAQSDDETKVYRDWIDEKILTKDSSGAPEAIMILPLGRPGPNYRDIVPPQQYVTLD
ncbi:hypothetical protein N7509_000212 [Penicillium cosmopolitanum]|uniref:Amidase domain-containing protein n=1 Tax=Penicillium cosmopolitanum TaxID=1131564 RepID=A0A9W9WCK9_9EURO|nr:uncharacterized protein N7509_000212 [Penicillium cosmopolitanum]KAJ5414878.1 hypothetical protein N7509_000212 [Penicillium cosmopolitanum]